MSKPLILKPHQPKIIEHIIKHKRCAVWAGMGVGKTSSALTAVDELSLLEDVYPVLVVAPLRVAQTVWSDEVVKWDELNHIRVSCIVGDAKARQKAITEPAEVYTVNFENLPWLIAHLDGEWPYKMIIVDEGTKLKGFRLRQGGKRMKVFAKVAFKSPRFVELTGTPSPNGLKDLWGQLWFLDTGARLGRTFSDFVGRWFRQDPETFAIRPLKHAQNEIEEKVADICLSIRSEDYFDLKEPIITNVEVKLPPAVMKQYKRMEREMVADLVEDSRTTTITAVNAGARSMKLLQICNGFAYTDAERTSWVELHSEKLAALSEIAEAWNGLPIIVVYHFQSDLERLKETFPQGRVFDTKPATKADFVAGKIPMLFMHPASAAHGIDGLQYATNVIVFFGLWWDLEHYMQIIERIGPVRQVQAGFDRNVFIYNIVAKGTVDEDVIANRTSKASVQDLLLRATSRLA